MKCKCDIILFATDVKQSEYIIANKNPIVVILLGVLSCRLFIIDFIILSIVVMLNQTQSLQTLVLMTELFLVYVQFC